MADVFISYSKSRADLTQALAKELEDKGLSVWWDAEMIAGGSFRQQIQTELKECKAAIVIWTPQSVGSDYVLSEAAVALAISASSRARHCSKAARQAPTPFLDRRRRSRAPAAPPTSPWPVRRQATAGR